MKRVVRLVAGAVVVLAPLVAVVSSTTPQAGAALQSGIVVSSTTKLAVAFPKFAQGAPLSSVKAAYPEDCGLGGLPNPPDSVGTQNALAAACDVIPLTVQVPSTIRTSDDFSLQLKLKWPDKANTPGAPVPLPIGPPFGPIIGNILGPLLNEGQAQEDTKICDEVPEAGPPQPPGCNPTPSSDLDFWLYDNKQNVAGKNPVPEGTNVDAANLRQVTEYTRLGTGAGGKRPHVINLDDPRLVHYNIVVLNRNVNGLAQAPPGILRAPQPQPRGICPLPGGEYGCYVIEAKLVVATSDLPFEVPEPNVGPTENFPAPLPLPEVLPLPVDLSGLVPSLLPEIEPVNFAATVKPPPQAAPAAPVDLGQVEAAVDPLLESIKGSRLEDDLEAPELEVASAKEPPPVPPSGTTVAVSLAALPIVAAGGGLTFLLRRRSAFRLG